MQIAPFLVLIASYLITSADFFADIYVKYVLLYKHLLHVMTNVQV